MEEKKIVLREIQGERSTPFTMKEVLRVARQSTTNIGAKLSRITTTKLLNTTTVFLFAAPIVIIFYVSFVFDPRNADNTFLYVLQLIADSIAIVTMLGLWLTVLLDVIVLPHHREHRESATMLQQQRYTVDVFITAYNEPLETLRATIAATLAMEYPHRTIVLDDGESPELRTLTERLGALYLARTEHMYAKAGNVNFGLEHSQAEFFVIFDADQVPKSDFLVRLLPHFEDKRIAMVQSPQFFVNTDKFIAAGTAQAQEVFYRYVCPAKNISNSAFCVGTNVVFRRSAIDGIGGLARSHSEDIWTSYLLHIKGWHTIFVNEVLAEGQAPSTVIAYFKQQRRWARGGLDMLFNHNPLRAKALSIDQALQYFVSNAFFLVGISITIYILFPLLYLLFDIKPLNTENGFVWLLHYLPYFLIYYFLTWLLLGKLSVSTISTALASFYPYLLALFSVLFEREHAWVATTSRASRADPIMKWIWPHVLIILLTLVALVVGWYEPSNFWTSLFNTIWAVANMYLLFLFVTGDKRIVRV